MPAYNQINEDNLFRKELVSLFDESRGLLKEEVYEKVKSDLAKDRTTEFISISLVIGIGIFIIILGSSVIIFYEFDSRLKQIGSHLKKLTISGGDLSKRINIIKFDEIGRTTHFINDFIKSLSILFSKIKNSMQNVRNSTSDLNTSLSETGEVVSNMIESIDSVQQTISEQLEVTNVTEKKVDETFSSIKEVGSKISEQACEVEENPSSISQMTVSITSVHQLTEKAMDISNKLETASINSNESVSNTIEAIHDIESFSCKVEEAIEIISTIADQTNILAMNAAIEAVHAGEYGKGFRCSCR